MAPWNGTPADIIGRRRRPADRAVQHLERPEPPGWIPVDLGRRERREVLARLHMNLKPGAAAVGEGRHALDPLEGAIDSMQLEVLRLLVTELVTNSIRHAAVQAWITLDVEVYPNTIRVVVGDHGPGFMPPVAPLPRADRRGGWGLYLVDRLADRWGVANGNHTSVWFELDRGPLFAKAV